MYEIIQLHAYINYWEVLIINDFSEMKCKGDNNVNSTTHDYKIAYVFSTYNMYTETKKCSNRHKITEFL